MNLTILTSLIQNGFDTNQLNIGQTPAVDYWTSEAITTTSSFTESSSFLSTLFSTTSIPFTFETSVKTTETPVNSENLDISEYRQIRTGNRSNRTCGRSCRQRRRKIYCFKNPNHRRCKQFMMPLMSRNQISCGTSSLPFPRTLSVHDAKGNCLTGCPRCKQCGVRRDDRRDLRVLGGGMSMPGQLPWQIEIFNKYDFDWVCGGTLVSPTKIVTAAHCFRQKHARIINSPDPFLGRYQVKAGHTNRNDKPSDSNDSLDIRRPPLSAIQIRYIKKIAKHPKYGTASERDYDIAVIIVEKPFQMSSYVTPVCLPSTRDFKITIGKALVSGFGFTEAEALPSEWLRQTEINIRPGNYCHKKMLHRGRSQLFSKDQSICGIGHNGNDACEGDSGGPLVLNVEGKYTLVGVVSYGAGNVHSCGEWGAYTKVARFLPFIQMTN